MPGCAAAGGGGAEPPPAAAGAAAPDAIVGDGLAGATGFTALPIAEPVDQLRENAAAGEPAPLETGTPPAAFTPLVAAGISPSPVSGFEDKPGIPPPPKPPGNLGIPPAPSPPIPDADGTPPASGDA